MWYAAHLPWHLYNRSFGERFQEKNLFVNMCSFERVIYVSYKTSKTGINGYHTKCLMHLYSGYEINMSARSPSPLHWEQEASSKLEEEIWIISSKNQIFCPFEVIIFRIQKWQTVRVWFWQVSLLAIALDQTEPKLDHATPFLWTSSGFKFSSDMKSTVFSVCYIPAAKTWRLHNLRPRNREITVITVQTASSLWHTFLKRNPELWQISRDSKVWQTSIARCKVD